MYMNIRQAGSISYVLRADARCPHPIYSWTKPLHNCSPQGAQLMSQYGINVPPGIPVFKLDQLDAAVQKMKNDEGLVGRRGLEALRN